jgi:hypothetical protein
MDWDESLQSCRFTRHFLGNSPRKQASHLSLLSAILSTAAPTLSLADAAFCSWGAWEVVYHEPTAESMGFCDATGWADGGDQTVSLVVYDDGEVYLVFFDSAWKMTPGQPFHAIVSVDNSEWTIAAEAGTTSIHVVLNDGRITRSIASDFLDALASGTAITLRAEDGHPLSTVSLRGSAGAINALSDCMASVQGRTDLLAPPTALPLVSAEVIWGTKVVDNTSRAWVRVVGEVTGRTFSDFMHAAEAAENAHTSPVPIEVTLESPGGDLYDGIAIGEAIRSRQWSTVVEGTCASVCALMWLGGTDLWASPQARIGLHQAYFADGEVTVPGNAAVGSFLGRMGYSYALVQLATSAPPGEMHWLTQEEASDLDLRVKLRY